MVKESANVTLLEPCWIEVELEWVSAEHDGSHVFQTDGGQLQSRLADQKEAVYLSQKE